MIVQREVFDLVTEDEAIICDRCNATAKFDGGELYVAQEYVRITVEGGYGSEYFGDLNVFEVDLCERCAWELFGKYGRSSNRLNKKGDDHVSEDS